MNEYRIFSGHEKIYQLDSPRKLKFVDAISIYDGLFLGLEIEGANHFLGNIKDYLSSVFLDIHKGPETPYSVTFTQGMPNFMANPDVERPALSKFVGSIFPRILYIGEEPQLEDISRIIKEYELVTHDVDRIIAVNSPVGGNDIGGALIELRHQDAGYQLKVGVRDECNVRFLDELAQRVESKIHERTS